jgi:phosphotriesterase-related protein
MFCARSLAEVYAVRVWKPASKTERRVVLNEVGMTITDSRSKELSRREALGLLGMGAGFGIAMVVAEEVGLTQAAGWLTATSARPLTFPKGAIIRTLLKDVPPEALASGATMFHEHVIGNYMSPSAPSTPYGAQVTAPAQGARGLSAAETSIDLMVEELRQSAKDGVRAIVDASTTKVSARAQKNVDFLKQLATRVPEIQVIMAGGPFMAPYAPELVAKSVEQLADELVKDLKAQRWGAFGEIGTSMEMTAEERKILTAVAKAHVRTGLPLFSHTDHAGCAKCALDQLDLFESNGVDLKHLVIGHLTDIKPGSEPLGQTQKAIAKRGAFLGFDTVGHEMRASRNPETGKVQLVLEMINAGYEDNILLSADFSYAPQLKANWGNGFSTVVIQFIPKLKYAGVKDATLHKILVDNPRRFLSFVPKEG